MEVGLLPTVIKGILHIGRGGMPCAEPNSTARQIEAITRGQETIRPQP